MKKYTVSLLNGTTLEVEADAYDVVDDRLEFENDEGETIATFPKWEYVLRKKE